MRHLFEGSNIHKFYTKASITIQAECPGGFAAIHSVVLGSIGSSRLCGYVSSSPSLEYAHSSGMGAAKFTMVSSPSSDTETFSPFPRDADW